MKMHVKATDSVLIFVLCLFEECFTSDDAFRLVGGLTEYDGRLEVNYNGTWGTVCDDGLNDKLAVVACRSLGLPLDIPKAYDKALYGQGSGPIWLDNVNCTGSEKTISECNHLGWGKQDCGHDEDISISCIPFLDIRLIGGVNTFEGRLEVNMSGRWGTVCDKNVNNSLSVVVCRYLGLSWATSEVYGSAVYGQGSGPIWLDNVNCTGSEARIEECSHSPWGSNNCNHEKDVSINCLPNDTAVRLVGGVTKYEGRLEVSKLGKWGTVCHDSVNDNLSIVICRSLGLPWATSEVYGSAVYGQGSGLIWLENVICTGSEAGIEECSHSPWGSNDCNHEEDVSINCLPSGNDTAVRLVGGATEYEGRLEVYKFGKWGTVCDDDVNDNLSIVICRSLGLPWNTSKVYSTAKFRQGSGPIWLDDVKCNGSEIGIEECSHNPWGSHNCKHEEDVSISCLQSTGIPQTPINFTGYVYATSNINLTWISGSNEGYDQFFILSLNEGTKWKFLGNLTDPGEGKLAHFDPGYLTPGQEYLFRLKSCSVVNCSVISEYKITIEGNSSGRVEGKQELMCGANAIPAVLILSTILGLTWLFLAVFVIYKKRLWNLQKNNTRGTQDIQLKKQSLTQNYDYPEQAYTEMAYTALSTTFQNTSETPYDVLKI